MSFLADGKKLPFSRSKKRPREPEDSDVEESESSNSSGNNINEAPIENREGGGRKFSKTRITVLSFLVIVGTVCGAMTYEFTSSAEHDIYKEQFRRYASEVGEVSGAHFDTMLSSISTMALSMSSYALDTNKNWPFVTIPHFEQSARYLTYEGCAENLTLYVSVKEEEKIEWESYSVAHQEWIQDGLDYHQTGLQAEPIIPYIHKGDESQPDDGPAVPSYTVAWQTAPAPSIPIMVNYNALSNDLAQTLPKILQRLRATFSAVLDGTEVPSSHLIIPVYDQVDVDAPNRRIVGYLDSIVPFQKYFENIFPDMAPLLLVLRNSCGQTASFGIKGNSAMLVSSDSDVHDPKYDDWEERFSFNQTSLTPMDFNAMNPSNISLSEIYCAYNFSVYPTQEFEDEFLSPEPLLYTGGFVTIFLFCMLLIYIYDFARDKQKKKVEETAARDIAIIDTLFPRQVRDRLIRDNMESDNTEVHLVPERKYDRRHMFVRTKTNRTLTISNHSIDVDEFDSDDEDGHCAKLLKTRPIADLFANATVVFADISGFASWSANRTPADVFTLLETLYGSFDKIAKREHVFKVETIGGCYVAVTGLPEPRADHAEAMCRFALKCMTRMRLIFDELVTELGPETADLSMRFGLHSGPVTAGVLRGEKSRFQLFGDTVNTASRIESTGLPGCIHLSQSTGRLLTSRGKESWVEERNDVIVAKGKGELKTYFCVLTQKADALKQLVRIKDRTDRRKRHPNVFVGAEAVDALVYNGLAASRIEAVHLLRIMEKDLMLFTNVTDSERFADDSNFYRFKDQSGTSKHSGKYSIWDNEVKDEVINVSELLRPRRVYAEKARQFVDCLDIRDRKYHMTKYRKSFIGSDAVDALLFSGRVKTREEAVAFGRKLEKDLRLFYCLSGDLPFGDDDHQYYRLRKPREKFNFNSSIRSLILDSDLLQSSNDFGILTEKMEMFKTIVSPLVRNRKGTLKAHKSVFVGEEALDALVYSGFAQTRREAIYFGRLLAAKFNLFRHVLDEEAFSDGFIFYRFDDSGDSSLNNSLHSFDDFSESGPTTPSGTTRSISTISEIGTVISLRGELGKKADLFKKYIDVRDRAIVRIGSTRITYKSCFIGSEAVDALVYQGVVQTREEAVKLGSILAKELRLFSSVNGPDFFKDEFQYYRFRADNGPSREGYATEIDYLARKELIKKAEAFQKCCRIKDRYYHFRKYKDCFIGRDTIDAVVKAGVVETRMEAVELARTLARELKLLRHVTGDHAFCDDYLFFRFDDEDIREQRMKEYMKGFEESQNRSPSREASKGTEDLFDEVGEDELVLVPRKLPVLREGEEDDDEDESEHGSNFRDHVNGAIVQMTGHLQQKRIKRT